uniref:G_PROTEIN_RECEP_F1_2 domain-containing protein n=1 Tax=Panagrellus redivivus TaxID=6233 RepID=A0A7E4W0A4_PANRE
MFPDVDACLKEFDCVVFNFANLIVAFRHVWMGITSQMPIPPLAIRMMRQRSTATRARLLIVVTLILCASDSVVLGFIFTNTLCV